MLAQKAICYSCGKPYEQCGDVSMDSKIWNRISPTGNEGGLLCANCIMERLAQAEISSITVKLYPPFSKDI